MIIQRPGDNNQGATTSGTPSTVASNGSSNGYSSNGSSNGYSSNGYGSNGYGSHTSLDSETVSQIRSLLSQGYKIGTEHADKRRFRAKSWKSCSPIDSTHEPQVLSALEGCLQDHDGEYVRLIGIDTEAKRRVLEPLFKRP